VTVAIVGFAVGFGGLKKLPIVVGFGFLWYQILILHLANS